MSKTILITGSSDGIGLETARAFSALGHRVLLHGRNGAKLERIERELAERGPVESFAADLANLAEVEDLAERIEQTQTTLDVLINNAGVYTTAEPTTSAGLDARFVVNAIAPYLLTKRLLPRLGAGARVVNLSSAAQSPVQLEALAGRVRLPDGPAYAQSKLALTMWSMSLAESLGDEGPTILAVNPGSMLATNMVRQAYDVAGADIRIGVEALRRAAFDPDFATASGRYFDNDAGRFAPPHADALDANKRNDVVRAIETVLDARRSP